MITEESDVVVGNCCDGFGSERRDDKVARFGVVAIGAQLVLQTCAEGRLALSVERIVVCFMVCERPMVL